MRRSQHGSGCKQGGIGEGRAGCWIIREGAGATALPLLAGESTASACHRLQRLCGSGRAVVDAARREAPHEQRREVGQSSAIGAVPLVARGWRGFWETTWLSRGGTVEGKEPQQLVQGCGQQAAACSFHVFSLACGRVGLLVWRASAKGVCRRSSACLPDRCSVLLATWGTGSRFSPCACANRPLCHDDAQAP